jgi:hypothetical protein
MPQEQLDRLEAAFEAANVRLGEATWSVYSGEGEPNLDGAEREIAALLGDPGNHALVAAARRDLDAYRDPVLARRVEIWRRCFDGSSADQNPEIYTLRHRLQRRIAGFEPQLDRRAVPRSELQRVLRNDPDRDRRRRAWSAMSQLAAANRDDLRRLIELRNREARRLGYRDYVELVLSAHEIDESWLERFLAALAREARPAYARLTAAGAERVRAARLAPWDMQYVLRQIFSLPDRCFPADSALARLADTAAALGFDAGRLPIRTVVRDIPFGGYNVAVRIPTDTRFLVNPSEGHSFYATTFHEFGHSLQAVFTAVEWPILKEYEWVLGAHTAAYSEGMAEVLGDFTRRPDWLRTAGLSDDEIENYRRELLPAQTSARLFELLCNLRIELAAYREIGADTAARERELVAEIRMLDFPADEPPQWEANTWYTTYPVYWQNYILASAIAAQVHETLTDQFGPAASINSRVASFLAERFYAPGNSQPWSERIHRGTGRTLEPDALLRRMSPAPG